MPKTKRVRDWRCQECGYRTTENGARRAVFGADGCPKCGGSDFDIDPAAIAVPRPGPCAWCGSHRMNHPGRTVHTAPSGARFCCVACMNRGEPAPAAMPWGPAYWPEEAA